VKRSGCPVLIAFSCIGRDVAMPYRCDNKLMKTSWGWSLVNGKLGVTWDSETNLNKVDRYVKM